MKATDRSGSVRLREASRAADAMRERSLVVLRRGALDVELACPAPPNEQTPHPQDELDVILREGGEAPAREGASRL